MEYRLSSKICNFFRKPSVKRLFKLLEDVIQNGDDGICYSASGDNFFKSCHSRHLLSKEESRQPTASEIIQKIIFIVNVDGLAKIL